MSRSRVRISDHNRIPEVISKLDEMDGTTIRVGIFGSDAQRQESGADITLGHLAAIHEFGTRIAVTEKMRKYLASQGLFLKKSTQFIIIPERSFIRAGWDQNESEVMDKAESLIHNAVAQDLPVSLVIDGIGQESQGRLQTFARDLRNPENHPFTIQRKGSSNPLVDDGQLVAAIDYEVV